MSTSLFQSLMSRAPSQRRLWIASPYADDRERRVAAVRKWMAEYFAPLRPEANLLPVSPVASTGDWGAEIMDDEAWYFLLARWLADGGWTMMLVVGGLFGEEDRVHETSRGVLLERDVATALKLPILTIDSALLTPMKEQRRMLQDAFSPAAQLWKDDESPPLHSPNNAERAP